MTIYPGRSRPDQTVTDAGHCAVRESIVGFKSSEAPGTGARASDIVSR